MKEDIINIRIPAKSDYISTVRLAVSGIAGNMDYDVNEIEDIKSCVAESCIMLLCSTECESIGIDIRAKDEISVDVECIFQENHQAEGSCAEFSSEVSRIMIEALSDESEFIEDDGMLRRISFSKKRLSPDWREA